MATLDEMLRQGRSLRDQIELLNEQVTALEAEKVSLDSDILSFLQEQGIDRTGNDCANVSVSKNETASVDDWPALNSWIMENDALHLYQRRITSSAAIEYKNSGIEIPGINFFEKTTLNFRRK